MRAVISVLFVVVLFQSAVHAQPAQPPPPGPPAPYPYPPQPYPAPQPYPPPPGVVPPYQYIPGQVTPEEQKLLAEGEISDGRYLGGALATLFIGFGIGQAVQGRYTDTGWIFTLGETGSIIVFTVGVVKTFGDCIDSETSCDGSSGGVLLAGGLIGILGFRVWEVIDAFVVPPRHNARVRQLRMRLGIPQPMYSKLQPYVAPSMSHDGGGAAGLALRF